MARIIAIASGKGGVGKTTVALNLGTVLAYYFNKEVILIDCNVTTSHLGMYLGMYYSPVTLNKVLRGEVSMKEAVYDHFGGMKIVPASLSLSDLEGVDVTKLREKINLIADENEIIFLDAAPGLGRESIAALKAADEVLFVTTPYVPAVMDIVRSMEVVNEIGIRPLGIVLNMVEKEKYEMTPQEVEQLTRIPVIASIPFDKNIHKSLVEKLPVIVFKPNSKASKAFMELSMSLVGYSFEKKSIFSRIADKLRFRRKRELEVGMPSATLGPDMQTVKTMQSQLQSSQSQMAFPEQRTTILSQPINQLPIGRPDRPSRPGFPKPEE